MEPEEVLVSILGLKSEPPLEVEEIHRSVSCQTTPVYGSLSSMPVIFCALFSTLNEAATQADIPFKVSVAVSTETSPSQPSQDESTVKLALKQNDKQEQQKHVEETIENVINATDAATAVDDNDEDQLPDTDHQDDDDDDIDTDELLDESFLNFSPSDSK